MYTCSWFRLTRWLSGKEPTCDVEDAGDAGLIPGSGRSPGGGHGNPLQYSCLENPMDRGAWQAAVHRVTMSWTRLSTRACTADSLCCIAETDNTVKQSTLQSRVIHRLPVSNTQWTLCTPQGRNTGVGARMPPPFLPRKDPHSGFGVPGGSSLENHFPDTNVCCIITLCSLGPVWCVLSHSVVSDSASLWIVAYQAPLSMELSRQEYWSGLPFSSPGDLPDSGIEYSCLVCSCIWRRVPYHWCHLGSPKYRYVY